MNGCFTPSNRPNWNCAAQDRAGGLWKTVLAAMLLLMGAEAASAQPSGVPADTARPATPAVPADTLPPGHPNRTPYRSDRSFGEYVLAAPAYLLHWATRPLGWAVKEAEERFPKVFEGALPPYGFYPLFETGGESKFAAGVVAFYNDLPWGGHAANVRALVGSRVYNRFEGRYEIPDAFGQGSKLEVRGRFFSDPRERLYLGGNDADPEDDRARYAIQQFDAELSAGGDVTERLDGTLTARFQRAEVDPDDAKILDDDLLLPDDLAGVGRSSLLSAEAALGIDLTSRQERSVEGTRLHLAAAYGQSVGDERFRFGRYEVEVAQFAPVPFLPAERRLALRARLEKIEAFGDRRVPFYRLPSLGGAEVLRGYGTHRFQNEGALTLTAEYRYPIWSFLDAVLFAEGGQVFNAYSDLAPDRFHAGYGGGFHVVTGGRLAFRFEVAAGGEGLRTILTVEPAF